MSELEKDRPRFDETAYVPNERNAGKIRYTKVGIKSMKDVPIPMRDGLNLAADVYMPDKPGRYPVILAFTGFGKDHLWTPEFFGFGKAYEPWSACNVLNSITFEANDPNFWCNYGYSIVICDPRGFGHSPGEKPLAELDGGPGEQALIAEGRWARDQYDVIEWIAQQDWCTGAVGLSGVSILGFSQWRVAAMNPPHLKCFDPWEAMINFHRDCKFPGGIPETEFTSPNGLAKSRIHNPAWPAPEVQDPPKAEYMEEDEFLAKIKVPALIAGNWMDHGCHTRGSFKAFQKISSEYKWLYTHGLSKWAVFYSSEARTVRKLFFDHFLKGTDSRILDIPRVQLMVMENMSEYTVRFEPDYPIKSAVPTKLYLDSPNHLLSKEPLAEESASTYNSAQGFAYYDYTFEKDTELIGPSALKLWVSTDASDDMDLFVTVRKFDKEGKEVFFDSVVIPENWSVAVGWMRVSYRELDPEISTPLEPFQKKVVGEGQKIKPNEIVETEIAIWPTGVLFKAGEKLRVEVSGKYRSGEDLAWQEYFYDETVNNGNHTIHTGGQYGAYLLLPLHEK